MIAESSGFRIRPLHLQMEPLCCIASCLVRGGCAALVCFEVTYVIATVLLIGLRIYHDKSFWYFLQIASKKLPGTGLYHSQVPLQVFLLSKIINQKHGNFLCKGRALTGIYVQNFGNF